MFLLAAVAPIPYRLPAYPLYQHCATEEEAIANPARIRR
jgi:hypothetical protein